jgi:hypothetical protein
MLVNVFVGMFMVVVIMPMLFLMLFRLGGRDGVGLGQNFAGGFFIRLQMALLVFLSRTAGTIVVSPRLDSVLPGLLCHKSLRLLKTSVAL